jgi:hypothetical protein
MVPTPVNKPLVVEWVLSVKCSQIEVLLAFFDLEREGRKYLFLTHSRIWYTHFLPP